MSSLTPATTRPSDKRCLPRKRGLSMTHASLIDLLRHIDSQIVEAEKRLADTGCLSGSSSTLIWHSDTRRELR